MPRIKLLYVLLIMGVALCLSQIWWPHYYLTGDGPCHLYNANVLHNIWNNNDVAFYSKFYQVIYDPNPNWLSHILLGLPLYFTNGVIAEKLFLSVYAGLLIGGFFLLMKKVSGSSSYWITLIFLFVFHHTLAKGFYNFSLSTAFYFWMLWSWLRFIDKRNTINTLVFFLFTGLIFFTQLLPFVFGVITCLSLAVSYALAKERGDSVLPVNNFLKSTITLGILVAPFAVLMFRFTNKEGGMNIELHHHFYRLIELVQFKYAINATNKEAFFCAIAGITIISLLIVSIAVRLKGKFSFHKYDGFLISLFIIMGVYLFFPEDFMKRVILMSMRAQLYVLALAVLYISCTLSQQIKNAGGVILFVCFAGLTIIRIKNMAVASEAAEDYNSVAHYIPAHAVVLPLDFAPGGKDKNGKVISDFNYLFVHALHYSAVEKSWIMLDNYEANAGYFPLLWTYKTNPYTHLSRNEGIEAHPPSADITAYTNYSGVSVDYVVLWGYDSSYLNKGQYKELDNQIKTAYHLVYTSPTNHTLLYEKNKPL